jgi:phosphoglycerate dehydrogenase-like enzyme
MALETHGAAELGLRYDVWPDPKQVPDLHGVDALVVTSKARVTAEVLEGFQGTLVLTTTSGWDHIDVAAAVARGITVGRSPLARRDAVVEQALSMSMGLLRRFPTQLLRAREGVWARGELPTLDPLRLQDGPLLVVGMGVIGRQMAAWAGAMGVEVWGVDPRGVPLGVREVSLDEALPHALAVTLHCALSPTSRGLITAERVARMSADAVLVNTSRGDVLDVQAAVDAVASGRLRGFATDVFPVEPAPDLAALASVDGVWLTPHAAGYARGLGQRVADEVVSGLSAWCEGRPLPHEVS